MKKPKTLFDQAIEIIEGGGGIGQLLLIDNYNTNEVKFFKASMFTKNLHEMMWLASLEHKEDMPLFTYTRLLLARELWNDGQEKYWKQGKFK